jgi:SAM-dependent methyltransferases related to tRNA (uracil-5-)-methyltransferase
MENKSLVNQILHNQKVTEYGYDGYGIVRINNNYPILVENALKDEIVDVQVIQQNAKFALGKVVTQHVKSEKRIDVANKELVYSYNAPLIIISYEDQLKFKTQVIKSMFAREFNFYDVADCKESKKQFHYRNKLTLHVQQDEKEIKIGFFVRNTHIILEQKNYDLVNEELDKIVKIVVAFLKANATQIRN